MSSAPTPPADHARITPPPFPSSNQGHRELLPSALYFIPTPSMSLILHPQLHTSYSRTTPSPKALKSDLLFDDQRTAWDVTDMNSEDLATFVERPDLEEERAFAQRRSLAEAAEARSAAQSERVNAARIRAFVYGSAVILGTCTMAAYGTCTAVSQLVSGVSSLVMWGLTSSGVDSWCSGTDVDAGSSAGGTGLGGTSSGYTGALRSIQMAGG